MGKRIKEYILDAARLVAWGVIDGISFMARNPWVMIATLIAVSIAWLVRSVLRSVIT